MSLSRAYELQRDVFFAIMGLKINERIPKTVVNEMWQYVGTFENMQELVYEIIACREMIIEDNHFIFSSMEDLGARTLKYSLNLEK